MRNNFSFSSLKFGRIFRKFPFYNRREIQTKNDHFNEMVNIFIVTM